MQGEEELVLAAVIGAKQIRSASFEAASRTCVSLSTFPSFANERVEEMLKRWLAHQPVAKQQKCLIALQTDATALIPESLYSEENAGKLLDFRGQQEATEFHKQHLPQVDAFAISPISKELKAIVAEQIPQAQLSLQVANLIDSLLANQSNTSGKCLYLFLHDGMLDCFAFDGRSFLLYNSNVASHANDVLYFTQLAMEQLQWQEVRKLQVWGATDAELLRELKPYFKVEEFRGVRFQKLSPNLSSSEKVHFADVFNLFQCA